MEMRIDAVYARQSVDKVDSISTESQIDFCMKEVEGVPKVYIDKGYSGKNIERPQFQALLGDIKRGVIRRVIVYRLDRISRSVLDFSSLIQFFQQYKVEFVSTMEKFDTASPIGKAMLMIVMVFAQLERETIQQRVTDAYHSRSEKGFFMGGAIPYGYALSSITIHGKRSKMYTDVEPEIQAVREMYRLFSEPQTSFGDVAKRLTNQGVLNRKGKAFSRLAVRDIILNPIYVMADIKVYEFFKSNGADIADSKEEYTGWRGAYLYSVHGSKKGDKIGQIEGYKLVLARHQGAVDAQTWLKCRRKCQKTRPIAQSAKAKNSWLAGKIKCARCGYAMSAKVWRCKTKADTRFFICSRRCDARQCDMPAVSTDEIESTVYAQLADKLAPLRAMGMEKENSQQDAVTRKKIELDEINAQIDGLVKKIPSANDTLMAYINQAVADLEARKIQLKADLVELFRQDGDAPAPNEISDYLSSWDSLSISDRVVLLDQVIEKVIIDTVKITIFWRI